MKAQLRKLESYSGAQNGTPTDVEHPHVMPMPVYFGIFAALLILTVLTVGVSLMGLPAVPAIIVAVVVATIKATMVVLYFMHLRYENTFFSLIFVGSLFFVALFFIIILLDMHYRGLIIPQQATEYYRTEQLNLKKEADFAAGINPNATPAPSDDKSKSEHTPAH